MQGESTATILLVEDNPADARLLVEALRERRSACRVARVADGRQALAYLHGDEPFARAPRPDLLLLDLNLPGLGGRELLARIKRDPALGQIPVIVLSSSQDADEIAACYALHANAYVSKPVEFEAFSAVVQAIERFWLGAATLPARGRA